MTGLMRRPDESPPPLAFLPWEWAAWTLTCLLALMLFAISIQRLNEQREWSHVAPAHAKTKPPPRYGLRP